MSHFDASFDAEIWDMTMPEAIIWNPVDIRNEVAALGLDVDGLQDCVRYAERESSFVTANDAVGFAAIVVYDKAGRALREKYVGADWVKDDSYNQCAIKNPAKKIRVVPCNFNEFAGNRLFRPTNRSPKGEVSREKSRCNRTGWLPNLPREEAAATDGFQTWLLGMFIREGRPTTAEISLPIDFDGYHFTDFGKRIMLLTGDNDLLASKKDGDNFGGDVVEAVDIPIRRK